MDTAQLVSQIKVDGIQLYRWKYALRTFEEFLIIHILSRSPTKFQILELQYEQTALGYAPFIIINGKHKVPPERFGMLALTFSNPRGQEEYFNGRAILQATQLLTDYQLLEDVSAASNYWLFFSPFKKFREYMRYRKTVERLERKHIEQNADNTNNFIEQLIKCEPFLKSENPFTRIVIRACIAFFQSRDGYFSNLFVSNSEILKFKEQDIRQGIEVRNRQLLYFELKEAQKKKQDQDEEHEKTMEKYKTKNAIVLTILGFVTVWVPIILSKN